MKTKKGLLITIAFIAFALLIMGNYLYNMAGYTIPPAEWQELYGAACTKGKCISNSSICNPTLQCFWKVVNGKAVQRSESMCDDADALEEENDEGYNAWGIDSDPTKPVATTSDNGICKIGYSCTWNEQQSRCEKDPLGGQMQTIVDRGCTDYLGGHGTAA